MSKIPCFIVMTFVCYIFLEFLWVGIEYCLDGIVTPQYSDSIIGGVISIYVAGKITKYFFESR